MGITDTFSVQERTLKIENEAFGYAHIQVSREEDSYTLRLRWLYESSHIRKKYFGFDCFKKHNVSEVSD